MLHISIWLNIPKTVGGEKECVFPFVITNYRVCLGVPLLTSDATKYGYHASKKSFTPRHEGVLDS